MSPRYQTSPYVRVVRPENGTLLAYHSLLGNGRIINERTAAILDFCRGGIDSEGLVRLAEHADLLELFKLSFLHEMGFDDRAHITTLLDRRRASLESGSLLTHLQLIVTNACNFSCQYCFAYTFEDAVDRRNEAGEAVAGRFGPVGSAGSRSPLNVLPCGPEGGSAAARNPPGFMSVEVAQRTIDCAIATCLANGRKQLGISFFGGEPAANRNLIEWVLEHYRDGRDHSLAIEYEMTTNGSLLDEAFIATLARHRVRIGLSVDYIDHATGEYRGAGGVTPVNWKRIERNILGIVRAGLPVQITSVLSSETWPHWGHDLIDFVADAGIPNLDVIVSFRFSFLYEQGPENVADRLLRAWDHGQRKGVLLTGYWYYTYALILDDELRSLKADYKTCPAIGRMLSIEPNGAVFSCKTANRLIGTVDDWDGLFRSPTYAYYAMRAYSNSPSCHGCEIEGFCSGSCLGAPEETHDIYAMDPGYCIFMKRIVRGLLDRHIAPHGASGSRVQHGHLRSQPGT